MNTVKVTSYTAQIYVGMRERNTDQVRSIQMAREWLQNHVNEHGLCVTLTATEYIYTNGSEPGFIIGIINYPRFPSTPEIIRNRAFIIANAMRELFRQGKTTIVFPDESVMFESLT